MQLVRLAALGLALIAVSHRARADEPAPATTAPGNAPATAAPGNAPATAAPGNAPATAAPGNAPVDGSNGLADGVVPERADDPDGATPTEDEDTGAPTTGALQGGVYYDSDHTQVLRSLATIATSWGNWGVNGRIGIDSVTSASLEVRSSPALSKVDTVTSASGRSSTSGGQMTDTRAEFSAGVGWNNTRGHAVNLTASAAAERDYASVSGGLNGSIDILDRSTTLLGGVTATQNWISSVLDTTIHNTMSAVGWSAGVARVLTPKDAIRARYDGRSASGYNASVYRTVRFGDWTTTTNTKNQIIFANTIGDAGGLAEHVPDSHVSHAVTVEWLHSLASAVAVHPQLRLGHDDWGSNNLTASLDLRVAESGWRMQLGYRYYLQSAADFFLDKYTLAPAMYTYYSSDKELGAQHGHLGSFDVSFVLRDSTGPSSSRLLLDARLDVFRYTYPGYTLLPSRTSMFTSFGLTWEL
jgi:hypothetical protein